jgi:hypothetical protein
VVRRTFWLIKVVPTWKEFEKRCFKGLRILFYYVTVCSKKKYIITPGNWTAAPLTKMWFSYISTWWPEKVCQAVHVSRPWPWAGSSPGWPDMYSRNAHCVQLRRTVHGLRSGSMFWKLWAVTRNGINSIDSWIDVLLLLTFSDSAVCVLLGVRNERLLFP